MVVVQQLPAVNMLLSFSMVWVLTKLPVLRMEVPKLYKIIVIKSLDIASYLKLPPVKLHCSLLAEDAIKQAIKNYKEKNSEEEKAVVQEKNATQEKTPSQ